MLSFSQKMKGDEDMKLHEKIFNQRKLKGMSQEELAEKIGVSRQAVSKWETGEALPEITKLKALAEVFGVTTDFLLNDDEERYSNPNERKPDIFDRMVDKFDKLPDLLMPYLKKYAWVGGLLLIILGVYRVISILVSLFVFGSNIIGAAPTGFALSAYVSYGFSLLIGIALIVVGAIIVKKFKRKK